MDGSLPADTGDTGSIPGQKDSACCEPAKPVHHNYWAVLHNQRNHHHEKPGQHI